MFQIKQNDADAAHRRIPVLLVDITDGFTPELGVTAPTINVSKNGATPASGAGTWVEIGNGQYYYQLTTGEVDTLGWVSLNIEKATVSRDYNSVVQIMAYDPFDIVRIGLTALPNAAAGAVGGLPTGDASGRVTVATNADKTGYSLATAPLDATQTAAAVWNALLATYTTANSFGARIVRVRSTSPTNEAFISGSNHISADVHSMQNNSITAAAIATGAVDADALATDAVNEIADGLLTRSLATAGAAGNITITSIIASVFQAANSLAVNDQVTFIGTAPTSFNVGQVYYVNSSNLSSTTFTLGTAPAGLPNTTSSTGAFTASNISGRNMLSAMRAIRNKSVISSGVLTVYQEDDTAAAWTASVGSDPSANPIISIDPA
jgi:hypothetical protein